VLRNQALFTLGFGVLACQNRPFISPTKSYATHLHCLHLTLLHKWPKMFRLDFIWERRRGREEGGEKRGDSRGEEQME
jgi:hypothetical protein